MFHPLPGSAWADGKLTELAEQLGKMVEHPKSVDPTQVRQEMCHPAEVFPGDLSLTSVFLLCGDTLQNISRGIKASLARLMVRRTA